MPRFLGIRVGRDFGKYVGPIIAVATASVVGPVVGASLLSSGAVESAAAAGILGASVGNASGNALTTAAFGGNGSQIMRSARVGGVMGAVNGTVGEFVATNPSLGSRIAAHTVGNTMNTLVAGGGNIGRVGLGTLAGTLIGDIVNRTFDNISMPNNSINNFIKSNTGLITNRLVSASIQNESKINAIINAILGKYGSDIGEKINEMLDAKITLEKKFDDIEKHYRQSKYVSLDEKCIEAVDFAEVIYKWAGSYNSEYKYPPFYVPSYIMRPAVDAIKANVTTLKDTNRQFETRLTDNLTQIVQHAINNHMNQSGVNVGDLFDTYYQSYQPYIGNQQIGETINPFWSDVVSGMHDTKSESVTDPNIRRNMTVSMNNILYNISSDVATYTITSNNQHSLTIGNHRVGIKMSNDIYPDGAFVVSHTNMSKRTTVNDDSFVAMHETKGISSQTIGSCISNRTIVNNRFSTNSLPQTQVTNEVHINNDKQCIAKGALAITAGVAAVTVVKDPRLVTSIMGSVAGIGGSALAVSN